MGAPGITVRMASLNRPAVLVLALVFAAPRPSRAGEPADTVLLLERQTQALFDAVAVGRREVWERYLDPEVRYTDESGAVQDRAALLGQLAPLPAGVSGHIVLEEFRAVVRGDVAVAGYVAHEFEDFHGQALEVRYRETDTWVRAGDRWLLLGAQVLAVLADPPARPMLRGPCDVAGAYELAEGFRAVVRCREGGLEVERAGRPAATWSREAPDVFFEPGRPRTRRIFERDGKGRVTGFVDRREGHDVRWRRVGP